MREAASIPTIVQPIRTPADWQALLQAPEPVLLFKHSTSCRISRNVYEHFHAFARDLASGKMRLAEVRVIEERLISQQIAADTGIQHESPQAILLRSGRPVWHGSHREISQQALHQMMRVAGLL